MKKVDIKSIVIPNRSRSGNYPTGSTVTPSGGGSNSTIINQGGGVDLTQARKEFLSKKTSDEAKGIINFLKGIKIAGRNISNLLQKNSEEEITDEAIMSAARVILEIGNAIGKLDNKFLRKDQSDSTNFLLQLLGGAEFGKYVSGALGTGGAVTIDENGNSHAEFDYLTIRKVALFIELIIQEAKAVGGMLVVSPSGMTVSKVEETSTSYRCYFERTDGDRTLKNQFTVGTQARRQTFNLTGQAYYWRLVTAVGEDYVDLSKTDCDTGSTIPQAGDELVGLGHRTDKTRQAAIIISAFGDDSPSIKYYQGIDSFSLVDKEVKMDYYDNTNGRFKSITYGDTYVGARDKSTYMKYDQEEGVEVAGKVKLQAGSTGASQLEDLPDEIYNAVKIGGENLLLNTGFVGNYETLKLDSSTGLNSNTEMYNTSLDKWTGTATLQKDTDSLSGVSTTLSIQQPLSQVVVLIKGENYVISYKAKGTTIKIKCGGNTITQELTTEYKRYSHVFTSNTGNTFEMSGDCTICEIKLERGTIPTDWCPSVLDPNVVKDKFKSLWYLQDALKGETQTLGGLSLTSMIMLGKWVDGVMEKVNAGISGIYNDDTDVAMWSGGTFEQAIATVQKLLSGEIPTDEEWKSLAKFVATHGGDIFLRGYIYALGGVFRGTIYANAGEFAGYIKTPYILLNKSDAIYKENYEVNLSDTEKSQISGYLLNSNLNIEAGRVGGPDNIILPNDISYIGANVSIYNNVFPPYSRTSAMYITDIYSGLYPFGFVGGYETDESIVGVYSKKLAGGSLNFIGVPVRNENGETIATQWVCTSMFTKQVTETPQNS